MKKREPTSVGDILNTLKKTTSLGKSLDQAAIWERWEELTGKQLCQHGRPKSIKEGQLRVEVDSAVWMHKFAYKKWSIIKRINRMARQELVSDMFFELLPDDVTLGED